MADRVEEMTYCNIEDKSLPSWLMKMVCLLIYEQYNKKLFIVFSMIVIGETGLNDFVASFVQESLEICPSIQHILRGFCKMS